MAPFVPPPNFNPETDSSYGYIPDANVSIVFLATFALSGCLHLFQAVYWRCWWLIPTAFLACAGEVLGWAARYWSSSNDGTLSTPYLIQICATIIAPTPLLAAYFVLLGRLIRLLCEDYSRLTARKYTRIFTTVDIICLFVQAAGGALATGSNVNTSKLGGNIMLGGIMIQLVSLLLYITLGTEFLVRFHRNRPLRSNSMRASVTAVSKRGGLFGLERSTKLLLLGMAFSIVCIFIRAIYRTIELADGFQGRIIHTQVYFNFLDGMMILFATWSLNIFHPGALLPEASKDSQDSDVLSVHSMQKQLI